MRTIPIISVDKEDEAIPIISFEGMIFSFNKCANWPLMKLLSVLPLSTRASATYVLLMITGLVTQNGDSEPAAVIDARCISSKSFELLLLVPNNKAFQNVFLHLKHFSSRTPASEVTVISTKPTRSFGPGCSICI